MNTQGIDLIVGGWGGSSQRHDSHSRLVSIPASNIPIHTDEVQQSSYGDRQAERSGVHAV